MTRVGLAGALALAVVVGCTAGPEGSGGADRDPAATGGKADGRGSDGIGEVRFDRSFGEPVVSSPLRAGTRARVAYDSDRMYRVVDSSGGPAGHFASAHHCYGYGCCEVTFPAIGVHYRFAPDEPFADDVLIDGALEIDIPSSASRLEVYFDAPGYDLKTWYCGCDETCSRANYDRASPSHVDHQAWDSRYGRNFVLEVLPAPVDAVATVSFGEVSSAPVVAGRLERGGEALIVYDERRMYDVVDWSREHGTYFESSFHCYGYGCCEVQFPEIRAFYRFRRGQSFASAVLDDDGEARVDIPSDASFLEVYFETSGFEIKTWYCGCDAACADASYRAQSFRWIDFDAWDSRFGRNFLFDVAP